MRSLLLFIAVSVLTVAPPSQVLALGFIEPPEKTNREKAHMNIIFTGEITEESACSTDVSGVSLTGGTNLEKIYNYLRSKGLTPEQAAGAVGNIAVESAGTGDPQLVEFGYTPKRTKDPTEVSVLNGRQGGWGIIQWTPSAKVITLLKDARITSPAYELGTQLDLVWWHLNNVSPPGYQNVYQEYKTITDVTKATEVYMNKMEAPSAASNHLDERITRAKEALRQYGGGSSTTSPIPSTSGCENSDGSGGVASVNDFTFPLITTQKAITSNKPYPWCYQKTTNCHHDYKAADIMIPTGTTVIAAKSGRVQNVNGGNQHPNNVTITTGDGQGINYYTHMGANTAAVRIGQSVKAGDVLGKVGTRVDALNTDPHLHFDMLPSKYKYRPSCSGSSCSGYPFIEVQPALIETFKRLPQS